MMLDVHVYQEKCHEETKVGARRGWDVDMTSEGERKREKGSLSEAFGLRHSAKESSQGLWGILDPKAPV